jgi:glutamyl-tRNA synthetase
MLENGPSKNTNLMEWDKIWASNKKIIDVNSGRYYAISKDKISTLKITNF